MIWICRRQRRTRRSCSSPADEEHLQTSPGGPTSSTRWWQPGMSPRRPTSPGRRFLHTESSLTMRPSLARFTDNQIFSKLKYCLAVSCLFCVSHFVVESLSVSQDNVSHMLGEKFNLWKETFYETVRHNARHKTLLRINNPTQKFSADNEQHQCVGTGRVQCSKLDQGSASSHLHCLQDIPGERSIVNLQDWWQVLCADDGHI